ncbi:MAG TPA: flavodoxin family protein, partial [Methanomicrobia archaeon]
MKILYISGSPRKNSNTDYLLKLTLSITGGEFFKLADYDINP